MSNFDWIIGVDEVGAGCLAGPVVAGALAYPVNALTTSLEVPVRVYDSKALSNKVRASSNEWLSQWKDSHSKIVEISAGVIDEINILRARFRAMAEAVSHLLEKIPADSRVGIFVDGSVVPPELRTKASGKIKIVAVIKGDAKVFAIAGASILAKEYRDQLMVNLSKEFPEYGWESNVGYPTPDHKAALRRIGSSSWHRKSFQWNRDAEI